MATTCKRYYSIGGSTACGDFDLYWFGVNVTAWVWRDAA
jgi:hypothetical protein